MLREFLAYRRITEARDKGVIATLPKGYLDLGALEPDRDEVWEPDDPARTPNYGPKPWHDVITDAVAHAWRKKPLVIVRDPINAFRNTKDVIDVVEDAVAQALPRFRKTAESKARARYLKQLAKRVKVEMKKGRDRSVAWKIHVPDSYDEAVDAIHKDASRARDYVRKKKGRLGQDPKKKYTKGWSDDDYKQALRDIDTLPKHVADEVRRITGRRR